MKENGNNFGNHSIKVLPEEKLKAALMKRYPSHDPFLKQWTAFHLKEKKTIY